MKRTLTLILALLLTVNLAACASAPAETEPAEPVNLTALYDSFADTLPTMFTADADTMMNFMGISMDDCTQAVVALCADGLRTDEIWLLEAKDEEAMARLTQLAENRIQAKADETVSYSPDQYKVVEKAELISKGLYLALLVSPDVETFKTAFEDAVS